jgi:tetratricopeptide (TPR) repeat protein
VYKFKSLNLNVVPMPMPRVVRVAFLGFVILSFVLPPRLLLASAGAPQAAQDSENFEAVAAHAQVTREAGKTDEAIRDYEAGVRLQPNWEEGWWYLGTLQYDADHFAEAIPALRRVVELDSDLSAGWGFLGLCEFETGDYPEAYPHLQKAADLGFTQNPEIKKIVLFHLGLLLNLRGDFERASDLLTEASGPGPVPEPIKRALGLALLRVPLLPTQLDPSKDALVHASGETASLLMNRQMDAALRSLEHMLRDFPDTPYLHYAYGVALAAASQDGPAELQLREEIRARPSDPLPWIALARMSLRRKNFAEALAAAQRATQLAPRSAAAYEVLAQAFEGQSKPEEAATASRQALELAKEPGDIDAAQVKAYALTRVVESGKNLPAKSPTSADDSSVSSFPDTARLAEAAQRGGRLDEAAALYQRGVSLRSGWQEGWRQLGTIEYMRGGYPEAITALRQSVALEPSQPDTWTLLGLSEFETKDYRNARIHLERGRSLGFSGNSAAVRVSRYHLALLLNLDGDFDGAINLLIPEVRPGALSEEIQFAMGIALLRIPALPEQIDSARRRLVSSAGEAAVLLAGSYYDKAFQIFDRLLSENPDTPFLHYAYGDALASASRYDAAQARLRDETRLNPSSELAYIRSASIAVLLHQSARALEDSRKAVALAPESAEAHYQLGCAFLEEGDFPSAIRELEAARGFAPNSAKIHFNLARAYARANRATEAEQERAEFERLKNESAQRGQAPMEDRAGRVDARDESMQPVAK